MKDYASISDKNYKWIRKLFAPSWPSFYAVEKERKALNSIIPITKHPNGVTCTIESKLRHFIEQDEE
jgi:hypothetical protein